MKISSLFNYKHTLNNLFSKQILAIALLFWISSELDVMHAQSDARLSVQGILKKASGEAVADDYYNLKFKLWTAIEGGTMVWMEEQDSVEVIGGIYSTVLGNITPLALSFSQTYYLGVTLGSSEMKPRVQLTSAPYALALIGTTNQFPSGGTVIADNIDVNGNVLTQPGAPGLNGVDKNGYGFLNDKDSGLFSLTNADGTNAQVSLFVNNIEEVKVRPDSVVINGELRPQTIRMDPGGRVSYNGLDDWRLVETDYFETDHEEWKVYDDWEDGTAGPNASVITFPDDFAGKAITIPTANNVLKKKFTLPGSATSGTYTYIKVVFRYYNLDDWNQSGKEQGWAAFSKTEACTSISVGWTDHYVRIGDAWHLDVSGFDSAANFNSVANSDAWSSEEMVAKYPSGGMNTDFWVIFGFASDEGSNNENFAVGMVEIWVK